MVFISRSYSRYLSLVFFLIAAFFVGSASSQKPINDLDPTVILISLDGFRYDYLEKFKPKTLNRLAKKGVRAKWLIPSFPTKTFPNHYTIATGLYPENHGIVDNNIWDFGTTFSLGKREEVQNSRWWLGEPIWVTAEKQGQRTGAFFFPGTEAEIAGERPTFWQQYDGTIPNAARVDALLGWLDLPKDRRPTVFTLYFSDVDDAGHRYSPDSPETAAAVSVVDGNLKRLVDGLKRRKVNKKINLIIVSDHGMASVPRQNAVIMDLFIDETKIARTLPTGEILQVFPKEGQLESVLEGLTSISHVTCWRKEEIPKRLHYSDGPRVAPIICSAEEGWYMTTRDRHNAQMKRPEFNRSEGRHGYDNKYESMRAIFIGHGSAFRKGKTVEPFENTHIYELMCRILGLIPAKNDGDLTHTESFLR
ncbi:MAG: ectonucleotide pyrophosphatase/phosphodiesterase [Pyrinomonadaceae bacterium]